MAAVRVIQRRLWLFFNCFSSTFWSQIYLTPLLFSRHAPLSRIPCYRLLLPPEAQVTSIVGVQRVVCTRQRALCSLTRVTTTLRLFLTVHGGADLRLGGTSDDMCPPRTAVSSKLNPYLFCQQLDFCGFLFVCVVYSLVSPVQSVCVLLRFYWSFC